MIEDIELFIENPYLFGHYLGYTDLIPLHSLWIINCWIKGSEKAMQAHRGSYKTTSIIIVGVIWYLLFFDPNSTNLIIRKSGDEARKIGMAIQGHLESKDVLFLAKKIYGDKVKTLKTERWSGSSMNISLKTKPSPEGSIDTIGMGGSITGSHYDNIRPDDIITLRDRVSKAERERTKDFVRELRNVVKEDGSIFFSGTPWEKNDAWTIIPKPKVYPIGSVPIKGFLAHQIESKIKETKKGTTGSLYSANFELKHISDEDKIFKDPIFGEWPESTTTAYLDPSYSGENTTALSIGSKDGDKAFIRGFVWYSSIEKLYKEIANILKRYNCKRLVIEKNADKGLSKTAMLEYFPNVDTKHESENKHIRIVHFALHNFTNIIFANDCDNEYLNQLLDYVEGQEPDDIPDSLAGLMRDLGFSEPGETYGQLTGL